MDLDEINDKLVNDDLAGLERYFFRTYRGQVPDLDTYNITLDHAFKMLDAKWLQNSYVIFDDVTGKYKKVASRSSISRKKLLIIDAILTIKHRRREAIPTPVKPEKFDISMQLAEVV